MSVDHDLVPNRVAPMSSGSLRSALNWVANSIRVRPAGLVCSLTRDLGQSPPSSIWPMFSPPNQWISSLFALAYGSRYRTSGSFISPANGLT